ncbi:Protein CBR-GLB-5 [Caenorhabditis briggsae]|uniref:Protein CBR-GLB-5 n=1 Tax=Caenorhabditis briggsae TaxID=6238 RepID=A8X990_CAEBR|nr:Protein CBR-GLB-5 [Caenorhabditis briggsae]CAP29202.2 Protein CBR-GLB-5 [Caenorhabditis briggsae]
MSETTATIGIGKMYEEFKITQLVNETLTTVIENVQNNHDKISTKAKPRPLSAIHEEIREYDQLSRQLEKEYRKSMRIVDDDFELARAHWIQLQKSNKQGLAIRGCFLTMLEKYPQVRPIWGFGKRIEGRIDETWKPELVEDFYFRHHCASLQAALNMIIQNKDDRNGMRRMLNEMGAHHFFYDACEPHFEVFQDCLLESMRLVLNGGDALDDEIEHSWICLLQTIRLHMGEGIEIQRANYLSQCLIPKEMEEVKENWKKVELYGFRKAGITLCESAFKSYSELLKTHNLKMTLPIEANKTSQSFLALSDQIMMALDKTIQSYTPEDGFMNLIQEIRDFVIKFLVVEVCPPLIRKSFIDGMIHMLCKILCIKHVKEDFLHVWKKVYRVMEQSMIANIVEY